MILAAITITLTAAAAQASITRAYWDLPDKATGCYGYSEPSLCLVHYWVRHTWHAEDKHGLNRMPYGFAAEHTTSEAYRTWIRLTWRARFRHVNGLPVPTRWPWTASFYSGIMCVHHYEGAWNDETGNGYHGGLQMDSSFEQSYGPEFYSQYGDAGNWPPADQILAAWRAYQVRGWSPWPNTARMCGLFG